MADKLATLRVLPDEQGRMNLSLLDTGGSAPRGEPVHAVGGGAKGQAPVLRRRRPAGGAGRSELLVAGLRGAVSHIERRLWRHHEAAVGQRGPVTLVVEVRDGRVQ